MKTSTKWFLGGTIIVVGGGLAVALIGPAKATPPVPKKIIRRIQRPKKEPAKSPKTTGRKTSAPSRPPAPMPSLPTAGSRTGGMLASYEAVSHNPAPANAIQTAQDPANPSETWAIVPEGIHEGGNATETLWFGVRKTPTAPWTWIPSALPGQLSAQLPAPAHLALQWAFDLHENESGPNDLAGNVSWQSLQGAVSEPVGWTMQSVSAADSATGEPGVQIVVWQQSFTSFHGLYGMISDWDSSNLNGTGALNMFAGTTEPFSTVAAGKFL